MKLFNRKPDPLAEREHSLNAEIAALERRIKELSTAPEEPLAPKLRSTALPGGKVNRSAPAAAPPPTQPSGANLEPPARFHAPGEENGSQRSLWAVIREHFNPAPPDNPKLVNYLAAGSIQGLRPLRYEKRVARNRAIYYGLVLAAVIFVIYKLAS